MCLGCLFSVSPCAPTSNESVSKLSFKQEKQHLKLTPTLGSTLRTQIVSSKGFSEANKTVRNGSCRYESSLLDSRGEITVIFVLVRGELTRVGGWDLGSPLWPYCEKQTVGMRGRGGGQGGKLKIAKSYYILTGAG